jgi:hypothetical protein
MGSFSTTCTVSGLPITGGETVHFFLVTEGLRGLSGNAAVYPDDLWSPRTWPLVGKYDDYGGVEDYKLDATSRAWLDGFQIDLVEMPEGENPAHDISTSKAMTFDYMLNAIREERVRVRPASWTHSEKDLFIGLAMIRDDVWKVLQWLPIQHDPTTLTELGSVSEVRRAWQNLSSFAKTTHEIYDTIKDVITQQVGEPILPTHVGLPQSFQHVFIRHQIEKVTAGDSEAFLQSAEEFVKIKRKLSCLRHWWRPSYMIGPGHPEWTNESVFANAMATLATSKARE